MKFNEYINLILIYLKKKKKKKRVIINIIIYINSNTYIIVKIIDYIIFL